MIQVETMGPVKKFRLARTLLGRGRYFTACYLVDGVMVDTGCAHTVGELADAVAALKLEWIINTHSHEDHIAANAALQRRHGAAILAHSLALPVLAAPKERQPLRPYQRIMWGYPEPSIGTPLAERIGTRHLRFDVIHTPGHSPDHVCLYETENGWVFTGDAYVGGKDRALRADYNIWKIMASLKKIADLDPSCAFTGSGSVKEAPRKDILSKVRYLEDTAGRVRDLYEKGLTYRRIRQRLFGPEMAIRYVTLGHFSGKQLIRSFIEDHPAPI